MSVYGGLLVKKEDLVILGILYLTQTATECDYSAYELGCAYLEGKLGD